MEALARAPLWVTLAVAPGDPGLAGSVKQVLSTQDVHTQEELRILDRAVYMTLGSEVHHVVDVVLRKQFISQLAVADISLDKEATLVVDVVLDGTKVSGIGQCVEDDVRIRVERYALRAV